MIEMTLSSRHRIRNSRPGGLRPSTLPLGHGGSPQYWLSHVDGEETFFVSFKPPGPGTEPRTLAWKAAVLTTTLGPPPSRLYELTSLSQPSSGSCTYPSKHDTLNQFCFNAGPSFTLLKGDEGLCSFPLSLIWLGIPPALVDVPAVLT